MMIHPTYHRYQRTLATRSLFVSLAALVLGACLVATAPAGSAQPGQVVGAQGSSDEVCTTSFDGSQHFCTSYSLQLSAFHLGDSYFPFGAVPGGRGFVGGYKYVAQANGCLFGIGWGIRVVSTTPKAIAFTCIQVIGEWWSRGDLPRFPSFNNRGFLDVREFYLEEGSEGSNGYVGFVSSWPGTEYVKDEANAPVVVSIDS